MNGKISNAKASQNTRRWDMTWIALLIGMLTYADTTPVVRVPLNAQNELDVNELVGRLAAETGMPDVVLPAARLTLPITGVAGALGRKLLNDALGPIVTVRFDPAEVAILLPPERLTPAQTADLQARLRNLANAVRIAAREVMAFGLHARPSYRPNDPKRPTVCLVHGLNSTSESFMHLMPILEEAGFGVVVYDYPFNRSLENSTAEFIAAWRRFRTNQREARPWALLTHSMGGLLARSYVEGDSYGGDVSDLILIAPPNHGAALAANQTLLQLIQNLQLEGDNRIGAMARLSDGIGAAAKDLSPGSAFLNTLNARPRRVGVRYHIVAGSAGFVSSAARRQIEVQLGLMKQGGGFLGSLARLASGPLEAQLDEAAFGTGDGCVAIASTRLDGVEDYILLPANHVELIRGPLLYPDPGPVVCMPHVLRWLKNPQPGNVPSSPTAPKHP